MKINCSRLRKMKIYSDGGEDSNRFLNVSEEEEENIIIFLNIKNNFIHLN